MHINSIYDIEKESMIDLFSDVIFLRGEEYYEEGLIKSIEAISPTTITGVVQGTHNYVVSITVDNDGYILCDCSCPCDFNCKHAAAVLLKWLSIKDHAAKSLHKTKRSSKETLDQLLSKKSKDELISLIKTFIERNPELTSYVKINTYELNVKIQNLFSDFWEWHEVKNFISQLETLLQGIQSNKSQWNKQLVHEINNCSKIMIQNIENVHDDGELSIFLDEWFQRYGEIFSTINPTLKQKEEFIQTIIQWIQEDEYDLDYTYEQALLGMCTSKKDIDLIVKHLKSVDSDYYTFDEYSTDFLLQLYDKLELHDTYIEIAIHSGLTKKAIDKLMVLDRYEEALSLCEQSENSSTEILMRRADILKKLGRTHDWHQCLIMLIEKTERYSYTPQLKQGSKKEEWDKYREEIITYAKKKGLDGFLSRLYYDEGNYKEAYEYARDLSDEGYLELLAKKLSDKHPHLACTILKKLCFDFVLKGSGWPYKKAGMMLQTIKKIDNNGEFFKATKQQLIRKHKKKYSLMDIIEKI